MRPTCLIPLLLLACQPKPQGIEGPPRPWGEMDDAAREAHMSSVVLPHMKEAFQRFDAERYADFGCPTCHVGGSYEMPNPRLPVLSKTKFRKEHWKKDPEMVQFMWEHVEPEMAALLGQKGRRFNCRSCHTTRR